MPKLHVCADCWRLTEERRCELHKTPADRTAGGWKAQHGVTHKRIAGRQLQRLRDALFSLHPFCQQCHVRVSEIRDHIIPLAEGGTDDPRNIQALCQQCSDDKTRQEAHRGRLRGGSVQP